MDVSYVCRGLDAVASPCEASLDFRRALAIPLVSWLSVTSRTQTFSPSSWPKEKLCLILPHAFPSFSDCSSRSLDCPPESFPAN